MVGKRSDNARLHNGQAPVLTVCVGRQPNFFPILLRRFIDVGSVFLGLAYGNLTDNPLFHILCNYILAVPVNNVRDVAAGHAGVDLVLPSGALEGHKINFNIGHPFHEPLFGPVVFLDRG